ncbi:MAG: EVE domain-containing protein [Candidatus Nanoarchaeia archaeon]|nr:EVE domain-containing protein [Candidatus Nanoarchaeia archaeon]
MVNYWILTGSLENWDVAIANSIWGVRDVLKSKWDSLDIGDILFFYTTIPVSGIIGVGRVTNKFESKSPLWADEIRENKLIYPYRFEFQTFYVCPQPWADKKISIGGLKVGFWAGLNFLNNEEAIEELKSRIRRFWKIELGGNNALKKEIIIEDNLSFHDSIKNKIKEIGLMKNLLSEVEFQISETDRRFLDVIWRPIGVSGANPKYIFEIEDKGGLYRALAKLKHCFDLWGFPKLFIVVNDEDVPKINQLIDGTFHEIKDNLKILTMDKINEMYEAEKRAFDSKQNTGLP